MSCCGMGTKPDKRIQQRHSMPTKHRIDARQLGNGRLFRKQIYGHDVGTTPLTTDGVAKYAAAPLP